MADYCEHSGIWAVMKARTRRAQVFVSYASVDRQTAELVVAALEDAGMPCWYAPRNIAPGSIYAESIIDAINTCRVILVLLTTSSSNSPHVIREIERAVGRKLPLLCIRFDSVILTGGLEYLLSISHWLDVQTKHHVDFIPQIIQDTKKLLRTGSRRSRQKTQASLVSAAEVIGGQNASALQPTIAVWSVQDLTATSDAQYLCDGIAEDIISRLSCLQGIRTLSSLTMSLARQQAKDPILIARRLGAEWLLQGSIIGDVQSRKANIRLTQVSSQSVVWSMSFDLDLSRLLDTQARIADMVSEKLGLQFSQRHASFSDAGGRRSAQATDTYLRARFHAGRRDRQSMLRAIELCKSTIENDSHYVEAMALLSEAYTLCANYGFQTTAKPGVQAFELATRALAINGKVPEVHIAMGLALRTSDFARAAESFRGASALSPGCLIARHYLAHVLVTLGRYSEAAEEEQKALEIDPLYPISRAHLVRVLIYEGKQQEAAQHLQSLIQDNLSPALTHSTIGWKHWCANEWEAACEQLQVALGFDSANVFCQDMYMDCLRRLLRFDDALAFALSPEVTQIPSHILHARVAQVYIDLGDSNAARQAHGAALAQLELTTASWLNNRSAAYYYNLALIEAMSGAPDDAAKHLLLAAHDGYRHHAELVTRPDWKLTLGPTRVARLRKQMKLEIERSEHL